LAKFAAFTRRAEQFYNQNYLYYCSPVKNHLLQVSDAHAAYHYVICYCTSLANFSIVHGSVSFPPNFQCLLAVKLYVRTPKVLQVQDISETSAEFQQKNYKVSHNLAKH